MAEKDKKGIFDKVTDAFSSKDEKEEIEKLEKELEEAKKEAEASKKAIKSLLDQNKDKSTVSKKAKEAEEKIKNLENKLEKMEHQKAVAARKQSPESRRSKREMIDEKLEAEKPNIIATHTVQSGETLSHVALKYYNHATPPYWKYLLEHNKEALKGNERNVRKGMELEIPELPEDLKD